eukprot:2429486-Rhodomonas_salina.2
MPLIRGSVIWSCMRFWASRTSEQCIVLCPRVLVWRLQRTQHVSGTPLLFLETTEAVGKQKLVAWRKSRRVSSGMVVLSCITSPRISRPLPSVRMKSELFASECWRRNAAWVRLRWFLACFSTVEVQVASWSRGEALVRLEQYVIGVVSTFHSESSSERAPALAAASASSLPRLPAWALTQTMRVSAWRAWRAWMVAVMMSESGWDSSSTVGGVPSRLVSIS